MSLPRFFVDAKNKKEHLVYIDNDENVHLNSVLRLKVNDIIDICFNDGLVYECILKEVNKKYSVAEIIKLKEGEKQKNITLFMALISADKLDLTIQKTTELGVSKISPFESEYCTVKDKGNKQERLSRIALNASKQSGRARLPVVEKTRTFDEMLACLSEYKQIILAYEKETQNAKDILSKLDANLSIAVIIGCEGGFSEDEVKKLKNSGARCVSLGDTILRAETASIALLSAINYELNFWERNK